MMDAEASAAERNQAYIDMDDLLDDPDLQRIHEERNSKNLFVIFPVP